MTQQEKAQQKKLLRKYLDEVFNKMSKAYDAGEAKFIQEEFEKKKKAEKANEAMNTEEFIAGCRKSGQRHVNIVGEWADELKLNGEYKTRGQWHEFLKRNLRIAKRLSVFTDEQISGAMVEVDKAEYIDKVTLETVYKFLVK